MKFFHTNGHFFLENLVKLEIKNSVLEWQVFVWTAEKVR